MIQKFRKKPVEIEAVQLLPNENSIRQCLAFINQLGQIKGIAAEDRFTDYCNMIINENKGIRLKTLESDNETQIASFGDWIIKGVKGELYPCKPDIFERTYDKV